MTTAARKLSGAYPQDALINRFICGLPRDVRDKVQLEEPKYKGADALTNLSELDRSYHLSRQQIVPEKLKPKVRFNAMSIDEYPRGFESSVADFPPPTDLTSTQGVDSLALCAKDQPASPPTRSDYTPTPEFSDTSDMKSVLIWQSISAVEQRRSYG